MAALKSIMWPVIVVFLLFALYWLATVVYLLTWHPLAKYPGPRLAAVSDIWWAWAYTSGRYPFIIQDAHRKYGDVVRVAPNHLVFGSLQAYHDIHGLPSRGRPRIIKDEFYNKGQPIEDIIGARDPALHAHLRRQLAPAFSPKALRDQEHVVRRYADFFVQRIGELGRHGLDPINITEAWNWVTFDIIGELAFRESLGAVAAGQPKHPWISFILDAGYWLMLHALRRRMTLMKLVLPFILPRDASAKFRGHQGLTLEKARRRLAREEQQQGTGTYPTEKRDGGDLSSDEYYSTTSTTTGDFFAHILHQRRQSGTPFSEMEMATHGRVLISAGSETMATSLTAITQYLVSHPECLAILTDEIRTRFPRPPPPPHPPPSTSPQTDQDYYYDDDDGISNESTLPLPYLNAVIEEGLRLLPVASFGQPRTLAPSSPPPHPPPPSQSQTVTAAAAVVDIDSHLIPAGVTMSTSSYALARDPRYWYEPEEFRPERWLTPAPPHSLPPFAPNPYYTHDDRRASNPFGLGSRSCLGVRLAYLELRVLLAKVVHAYDLELVEGQGEREKEQQQQQQQQQQQKGRGEQGGEKKSKAEDWNRKCRLYLLWRKPEVLVRFRPRRFEEKF